MATKSELYKQLSRSCSEDWLNGRRKYIPVDVVDKEITRESIKVELGRNSRRFNTSGCLADKIVKRNARRLFVILVYLKEPWDVKKLLNDGFTDDDLPLERHDEGLRSSHLHTKIFEEWDYQTVDDFLTKQWMVLAPVFDISGEHMVIDPDCPLPFSEIDETIYSASTVVFKAKVHPFHQKGFEAEASSLQIALKEFKYKEDFDRERENLEKIRGLTRNEHITLELGTFSQRGKHYIIFPWAEGGDLDNLWKEGNSKSRTPELTLWSLQQMLGLAETLESLHQGFDDKTNCRHGDLKPGNILHFLGDGEGILKITDFGISKIHNNATYDRKDTPTKTRATTPSYEAPEAAPAFSKKQARSRKYDVWSMGCIFLEFTIWLVGGWEDVKSFNEARKPESATDQTRSHFYEITDRMAQVHPAVYPRIADLKKGPQSKEDTALGELLDLIESSLLEVDVEARYDATKLCKHLKGIVDRAESDPVYLFNTSPSASIPCMTDESHEFRY